MVWARRCHDSRSSRARMRLVEVRCRTQTAIGMPMISSGLSATRPAVATATRKVPSRTRSRMSRPEKNTVRQDEPVAKAITGAAMPSSKSQ